jgi:hypothetical protein
MRPRPMGFEVCLLRRLGASFAFPGGAIHPNEDPRVAAARVLFEDAGVLLGRDVGQSAETLELPSLPSLRKQILAGSNATETLRKAGFTWSSDAMLAWSHWLSPSSTGLSSPGIRLEPVIDSGGSSVRLFVTEMPVGMPPTVAKGETVESIFIRPSDAELRADELQLSPHTIRTCWELQHFDTIKDVLIAARTRASEQHPILPRMGPNFCLLLPWDPEYVSAGQGESLPFTFDPKWAQGPSRFVREDRTWKLVAAPGSKTAG